MTGNLLETSMFDSPFFSVIIPLYNKEKYIGETIASVLAQTYGGFEVIVVNDSSTDGSLGIVSKVKDWRLSVFTKPNGGVSAARNFGIGKANGQYVCFLDADDFWDARYLENLVSVIRRVPDAGFICGAYKSFKDGTPRTFKSIGLADKPEDYVSEIDFFRVSVERKHVIALTSSVCIRKAVLDSMGSLFPVGVSNGEDADLWVRAAMKTRVVYYNKPLMFYRLGTANSLFFNNLSLSKSFPYWRWYSLECDNIYKDKLTTRMIYTMAVFCCRTGNLSDGISCLCKCRGAYLLPRRLFLLARLMLKRLR